MGQNLSKSARLKIFARAVEENQDPTSFWVEIDRIRGQNEKKILPADIYGAITLSMTQNSVVYGTVLMKLRIVWHLTLVNNVNTTWVCEH